MIIGVGTDLIDIRRIQRALNRFGDRFCQRVYTPVERRRCERRASPAAAYAQYYAAKEACTKALGTGLRQGVSWRQIEVTSLTSGKPVLGLSGGAGRRLAALTPAGMVAHLELSLTDEFPFAHAIVLISAIHGGAPHP